MSPRVVLRTLVQAMLFLGLVGLVAGRAGAQAQQGTITGRVTDATTGRPLPLAGAWHKGGNYGVDVNLPVPQAEQNNPNLPAGQSCTDRAA